MKTIKYVSLMLIAFVFLMGCLGPHAHLETQSESDSKVTLQELDDNWSDYDIWFKNTVIVFDPKNDDKKILVGNNWSTVKDQATWIEIVKESTTSDGDISPLWANYTMTGVREIWSPDKQFFGYIIHQLPDSVGVMVVDENTMRVFHHTARYGGP